MQRMGAEPSFRDVLEQKAGTIANAPIWEMVANLPMGGGPAIGAIGPLKQILRREVPVYAEQWGPKALSSPSQWLAMMDELASRPQINLRGTNVSGMAASLPRGPQQIRQIFRNLASGALKGGAAKRALAMVGQLMKVSN